MSIQRLDFLGNALGGVARCNGPACGCHRTDALRFLDAQPERPDEVLDVPGINEKSRCTVVNELRDAADTRRDHRHTDSERFEDDARLVLRAQRRHDEHIGRRERAGDAIGIEPPAEREPAEIPRHLLEEWEHCPVTDDVERHVRKHCSELPVRLDEHNDPLRAFHLPDEEERAHRTAARRNRRANGDRVADHHIACVREKPLPAV